jgi:hypothetical protein
MQGEAREQAFAEHVDAAGDKALSAVIGRIGDDDVRAALPPVETN